MAYVIPLLYMDGAYKKYSADKIALLALFILAILLARLIVGLRATIVLSEPLKLNYTGLSVSMPAGGGWKSEKQWRYSQNAFTLSSVFKPGPARPAALASCRYLLADAQTSPDTRLEQKASTIGGELVEIDQIHTDTLTLDWARITRNSQFDTFFGTTRLPGNRQLDIEVHQAVGDTNLARQAFKRIAEGLKFQDNQLLEAGSKIIAEIKNKGLSLLLNNQNRENFFLIKNAAGRTIGFTMDVFSAGNQTAPTPDYPTGPPLNIQSAGFLYIRGRYHHEQVTFLQSNNRFENFTIKSETSSPAGRSPSAVSSARPNRGTETTLETSGVMTVRKFDGAQALTKAKSCHPGPAAIPDAFLELLFSQMLDSYHKKIIADIIEPDGTITPVLISGTEAAGDAEYVLTMELLNGRGFYEQVHLDHQKQISKRLLQQEDAYILERTSRENILKEFPERADFILRLD